MFCLKLLKSIFAEFLDCQTNGLQNIWNTYTTVSYTTISHKTNRINLIYVADMVQYLCVGLGNVVY